MRTRKHHPGNCQEDNLPARVGGGKAEFDLAKADNAHLHAQVASMAAELGQKNEEIRKYHAE